MKKFKNMKISRIFIFQNVIAVIISMAVVSVYSLREYRSSFVKQSALVKLEGDINAARRYMHQFFGKLSLKDGKLIDEKGIPINGRFEFVDTVQTDLNEAVTIFAAENDDYRRIITSILKEDKSRAVGTMLGKNSAAYPFVKAGKKFNGEAVILGLPYLTVYDPILNEAGEVIGILFVGIQKAYLDEGERSFFGKFIIKTLIASLIIIVISVLISLLLFRKIVSRPLSVTLSYLSSIEKGDLSDTIKPVRADEIGELVNSLSATVSSFRNVIEEITESASVLSGSIDRISLQNADLSKRTTEQTAAIEEMAAAIEETTVNISANADSAENAKQFSVNTGNMAREGAHIANETKKAIQDIEESSHKIGDILAMINELSFQTNLLALNAAVEAARAGEHGRGFAVVAGEVRNLSQRSASASKDIAILIEDVMNKISIGISFVNSSSSTLNEISNLVEKMESMIVEISNAGFEQKNGMNQINEIVSSLDEATQKNAYMVKDIASASDELVEMSENMNDLVKHFKI
ncbi:MAG: Cache 3/Cache 2 fusion domain-containing protein [Spirochaetes bacterium]|nr:Cache 3/Cache 2 fusion domain-containing protein [Spirochaetota bacterium]